MNLKKRLRHLAQLNQVDVQNQTEDTKLMSVIGIVKDNGGLFITTSIKEAQHIERTFGIPARSYDVNLEGYAGPFYFDPRAIEDVLHKAANKIELLEQQIKEMQDDARDKAVERKDY